MGILAIILKKKKVLLKRRQEPVLPQDLILTYNGTGVIFNEDGTKVLTFNGFQSY